MIESQAMWRSPEANTCQESPHPPVRGFIMSDARKLTPRFLLALAAAIMALLATTMPVAAAPAGTSAKAPEPGAAVSAYGNYYGAIALAMRGGAVGWSYDYGSKWGALRKAKRECKSASSYPWTCKKIAWVRNGCLAIAVQWAGNNISQYGWGVARGKRGAYWRALDECGPYCVKRAYTCTTR